MSSSGKNDSGLMSSAGLVRYFDSDSKNAIQIDPRSVLTLSMLIGIVILALHAFV